MTLVLHHPSYICAPFAGAGRTASDVTGYSGISSRVILEFAGVPSMSVEADIAVVVVGMSMFGANAMLPEIEFV